MYHRLITTSTNDMFDPAGVAEDYLVNFDNTVLVVSHDRDFPDGLVNKVFEFGNKRVKEYLGDIHSFLQKKT